MATFQWARLKANFKCALRNGAWYRILKLTSAEAVVDIKGRPVSVLRQHLQLSPAPARCWAVVPSPKNAPRYPSTWGPAYAVCPNCRDRAPLEGHPEAMRCQRCNGLFEVAWTEPDRAAG